jgi:hypothetical protein
MLGEFNVITIYGGHERLGERVRVLLLICTRHGEMSERGSEREREKWGTERSEAIITLSMRVGDGGWQDGFL